MTEEQLKKLALLAIQNEERLDAMSGVLNNLTRESIDKGWFKENALFLLSRVMTEDAFLQVAEIDRDKKRAEKRAFFGLT